MSDAGGVASRPRMLGRTELLTLMYEMSGIVRLSPRCFTAHHGIGLDNLLTAPRDFLSRS
jgi:hypothetical protein